MTIFQYDRSDMLYALQVSRYFTLEANAADI